MKARLIAVGTRGHSPVASLLLGSVSNAIIRQAPCPVLIVRDSDGSRDIAAGARTPAGR